MKAVTKALLIKENKRLDRLMIMLKNGQDVKAAIREAIETIGRLESK